MPGGLFGRISEPSTVLSLPKTHSPNKVNVSWGLQAELNCDNDVVPVTGPKDSTVKGATVAKNYVAEIGLNKNALLRDGAGGAEAVFLSDSFGQG